MSCIYESYDLNTNQSYNWSSIIELIKAFKYFFDLI